MYDSQSKGISYIAGFFMLIAFAVAGLFLGSVISVPVWEKMTGLSFKAMQDNISNPAYADTLQVIQVITAITGFLLPAIAAAFFLNREPIKLLGYSGGINSRQLVLVLLIVFTSLIVSTSLSYFNNHIPLPEAWRIRFDKLEEKYSRQVEAIVQLKNIKDYFLALFIMAFLPALCEETFFRGGLQNFLSRATGKPWFSILVVSVIFSLAHFSFYGFLYRLFLGVVLGALFQYSGRLWLSILAHFLNNAFALTVLYVYTQQGKSLREGMQEQATNYWGILALPVVIGLFVFYKNASAAHRRFV
jgi:uncharacterized protein